MRIPGAWDARMFLDGLPCLSTLSDDVLVDHVFVHLAIEDILSLRQVSKLYYNLTHHGIIWKRFLKRIGSNAPPLPPSFRHSLECMSSFEAERLVTRAITLHANWSSSIPQASTMESFWAHRQILSMVVLPGGKYLVASVCNPARTHYSLVVYALDHRIGGVVPLAETPVKQKAYNLRAKYMIIEGTPCIAIAYIRRRISPGYKGRTTVDPSLFSSGHNNHRHHIDSPVPLQYVCTCLSISLKALDTLANPRFPPGSTQFFEFANSQEPPFRLLSVLRSSSEFGQIDLADIEGIPNMAVAKFPNKIIFKELTCRGLVSHLICAPHVFYASQEHILCNFRLLPHQDQVLVIRTIQSPPPPGAPPPGAPPLQPIGRVSLGMFQIPYPGDTESEECYPDDSCFCDVNDIEDVQISDPSEATATTYDSAYPPPQIHIFYRMRRNIALCAFTIPPTSPAILLNPSIPHYDLFNCIPSMPSVFRTTDAGRAFALPGIHRTLICLTNREDRTDNPPVNHLFSYCSSCDASDMPRGDLLTSIRRKRYIPRSDSFARIQIAPELRNRLKQGVLAIAWDETIGRIFFAQANDPSIHVVDMAKAPHETLSGQRLPLALADDRMLEL
ncbi:hypothetical protein BJ138DRAFT_1052668 [Hygrophoropsis aurantiaca]|uniref:Uncharacterized protein n=1 Tax=Hygrophoropsis aurantiaca TaxID=72124 RepID=A0ACB8AT26_9AGAM|nr:hypothetical protein BJ138DRAFT_1052668 [Hygrophoropsis aurantiaca]